MQNAPDLTLSPSEKRTLQRLAANDGFDASELDWVALQRLKKLGLAEDRAAGVRITKRGNACFGDPRAKAQLGCRQRLSA